MRKTRTVTAPAVPAVPERSVEIDDGYACDICKKHYPRARRSLAEIEWGDGDSYSRNETELRVTVGTSFPDGTDLVTRSFDICPSCMEKVFDYLLTLGATPTESETSY